MLVWVIVTDLGIPPLAPTPYSFGQSAQLTTEKLALYMEAATQIASDMEAKLVDWLPGFTVEAMQLLESDADGDLEVDIELADSCSALLDGRPCGRVFTEAELALSLVTTLLGGAGKPVGESRPLTSVEHRVLDLVLTSCLEATSKPLLIEGTLSPSHEDEGTFLVGADDSPDPSIAFDFRIVGPVGGGRLVLSFDLWVVQRFSDAVDTRLSGRQTVLVADPDPMAANALAAVPVELVVELGRVSLTAREVVSLCPGDVVRTGLAVDRNPSATVDSVELFDVQLIQSGARLSAEVLEPMKNVGRLDPSRSEGRRDD